MRHLGGLAIGADQRDRELGPAHQLGRQAANWLDDGKTVCLGAINPAAELDTPARQEGFDEVADSIGGGHACAC